MEDVAQPRTPPDSLDVALPRDPGCAAYARRVIRAHLAEVLGDQALERTLLTASELVTNAWKHGEGTIELRVSQREEAIRVEVMDEGRHAQPAIREEEADETGGWGLRIVDELAVAWGFHEGATHVWADVALG